MVALLIAAQCFSACTAADTISVAIPQNKKGAGGASGGTGGGTAGEGVGGMSSSGAGGAIATTGTSGTDATGGSPNTTTGGGTGNPGSDASASGGSGGASTGMDANMGSTCLDPAACLKGVLAHRYTFDGTGTTVTDSIGTAHGTVMNGQLSGNGDLVLGGTGTPVYVDLPNGIVKVLTNATFEAWVTWNGGSAWQRLFDFGDAGGAENVTGSASTTFYLTPLGDGNVAIAAYKRANQTYDMETRAKGATALPTATAVEVAVVVDKTNSAILLYRNGALDGTAPFTDSLSMLNDINCWIGKSQYTNDTPFSGTIQEFRIYDSALSADAVQASFKAGPNPAFLN